MYHSVTTANVFRITYGRMIRCYVWSRAVFSWLHGSRIAVNDTLKNTIGNLFLHLYLLDAHCRQMSTSWKSRIFLFYIDFLSAVVLNPPCVPQNTIERFLSSIGKSVRQDEIFCSFHCIEILLRKTDILNINLAKPTWTTSRLSFFYQHFTGFYTVGIFQPIW